MKLIQSYSLAATMLFGLAVAGGSTACSESEKESGPVFDDKITSLYTNPVYRADAPDPSVVRGRNGKFYAYVTPNVVLSSTDLVNWERTGKAIPSDPEWLAGGAVWASDVTLVDNKYVMYYALSKWNEVDKNGIGVATAIHPEGPFTDNGSLMVSDVIGVKNSIDPCYIEDQGKKYLAWGSFFGIYLIELSANGLNVAKDAEKVRIAGDAFEGVFIHKHDGWFYLFASIGSCCEGYASTYETVVGRADNILGPYVDREGRRMLDNAYESLIRGTKDFRGPGHNSELITDDEGKTWIMYHAYDASNIDLGRCLMLDEVVWDAEGWPSVEGGIPSVEEKQGPVFFY